MVHITIPYGDDTRTLRVPGERLAWVLEAADRTPLPDVAAALRQALAAPIESPPLAELARRAEGEVVVLVDDGTRSTPQSTLLPVLLDELNQAGVPDERIVLLIALGTHRPMTEAEQVARFGRAVTGRVRVENLDSHNLGAFVDLGASPSGVPIHVARRLVGAGLSLAVGNIVPHMFTGFAGGSKMVQPGACSPLTTARTHFMAASLVHQTLGQVENPVRAELDLIGRRAGLGFIVNTVLNRCEEVIEVVAGDMVAAHHRGVATAREIFGVRVPEQPDVVVAGSYPADRDLWQGFKPLNAAAMAVRPGGEVILAIPAPEGIAPDHPYMEEIGLCPVSEVEARLRSGCCPDEVAAACYIAWDVSRRKARVTFVSDGITPEAAAGVGASHAPNLGEALEQALARVGRQARIGVMPRAGEILPLL